MGAAAVGAAAGTVPSGCASMPRAGKANGSHPCDSRYCRFYSAPKAGCGPGRCVLALREKGGLP